MFTMEVAITESFMTSVKQAVDKCMERVREESRIFANALSAVRHVPVASPVAPTPVPVPPVVPADTTHLEHRLAALELAYQRQIQKTIAGLSEDIGDLDGRLASLERGAREDDTSPWKQAPWSWPGPSAKNEVVVDDRTTEVDFGLGDVLVNVNHIDDDVEMIPSVVAAEPTKTVVPKAPEPEPEPEPEPKEDEEENLELEELDYEGVTYYKDTDNNVYKTNEDGEVDAETPAGRWLEPSAGRGKGKIKFY